MNGVIMVSNLNHVRERGIPLFEAALIGAGERLQPGSR
jgi:Cu/Ag efflux pump CusA